MLHYKERWKLDLTGTWLLTCTCMALYDWFYGRGAVSPSQNCLRIFSQLPSLHHPMNTSRLIQSHQSAILELPLISKYSIELPTIALLLSRHCLPNLCFNTTRHNTYHSSNAKSSQTITFYNSTATHDSSVGMHTWAWYVLLSNLIRFV